jgi:hypothetical protein
MDPRQVDDEICSQAPDRIIGAPRLDDAERLCGEMGELGSQQPMDEVLVDHDLVCMHPRGHKLSVTDSSAPRRARGVVHAQIVQFGDRANAR